MITPQKLRIVAEETLQRAKRQENISQFDLSKICFPEQLAFIQDPNPWVTADCSRRAGKTEVCAYDLLNTAIINSGVTCLYITLTRANAERIVWGKLLAVNSQYNLGGEPNISKLSLSFPNGSIIYLSGCNDKSELDKFRGLALKLVYIDEVQSFKSFIQELVDEVLGPALADYAGSLKYIGTPAPLQSGFFWEAINNKAYAHHHWTFWNNPFIASKSGLTHEEILKRELTRRGVDINHPSVRREWFGEWTTDTESLVFCYDKGKNHYDNIPILTDYVIGVDLGFEDADAIAIIGWHKHKKDCYLVEEHIRVKQGITELMSEIDRLIKKYNPLKVVMDEGGLGKKIAEELRKRYSLPIQAAEKSRKQEFIALLNDAMRTQKFYAKHASRFAQDTQIIEWDFDKSTPDKLVIKDEPHSDIADGVLYAYREALHWLSEAPKPKIDLKTQWVDYTLKLTEEQLEREIQKRENDQFALDSEAIMDMGLDDNPLKYYLNKKKAGRR